MVAVTIVITVVSYLTQSHLSLTLKIAGVLRLRRRRKMWAEGILHTRLETRRCLQVSSSKQLGELEARP